MKKRDKTDWEHERKVTLEEFLELDTAAKVAREMGATSFDWERQPEGGLSISWGRSNL